MLAIVPALSAAPMAPCVQPAPVRYTEIKGPKPVWKLATRKFSQSRPRKPRVVVPAARHPVPMRRLIPRGSPVGIGSVVLSDGPRHDRDHVTRIPIFGRCLDLVGVKSDHYGL